MTNEERRAILDQINALIEKIHDDSYGPSADQGKVVWPPNEEMSHDDAMATLFDIEDCDLDLTLYDEAGMEETDEWVVTFSGTEFYPDSPGNYGRKPLRAMLEEKLQIYIKEDNQDCEPARLLARLIGCFDDRG